MKNEISTTYKIRIAKYQKRALRDWMKTTENFYSTTNLQMKKIHKL